MPATGFYGGYLDGLQVISGLKSQQQQQQMNQMKIQREQQHMAENQQEKGILAQVFAKAAGEKTDDDVMSLSSRLAQQYMQAGQQIMTVNAKDGMAFVKRAEELQQHTAQTDLSRLQARASQDKYLSSVAANVEDQTSLDEAKQLFAKQGKTIPTKYQTWSAETKDWLNRQVKLSIPVHEQQTMEIQRRAMELKEVDSQRKDVEEKRKIALDSSREARLREGLDIKKRAGAAKATSELGLHGDKALQTELGILRDVDDKGLFKGLPAGKQAEAAQDVHMRATKIRADSLIGGDEPVSAEDALRLARQQVLGEMVTKPGGWFTRDSADRKPGGVEAKAPKTGPIKVTSDADYAAVPSGMTFMAPDGTIRRKP